jgi:hypothetical protein
MALLDLSKFSFHGDELKAIGEMIFDEVLTAPEVSLIHTIYPNILTDREVGFVGEGGLVGKKNNGCEIIPQNFSISTRLLKWEPEAWEILIHACWDQLKKTAAAYSQNSGTAMADFTNTDYMNVVTTVLGNAMRDFIIRFAWFNDKSAENYVPANGDNPASGGELTPGVDAGYFNIIDGFWKQIALQYTANAKQRVAIRENAGGNYAAQNLSPQNVQGYLQALKFGAPVTLNRQSGLMYICTQSVYNAYEQSLLGTSLESMYRNMIDGQKTLTYCGIPLVPIPTWDAIINNSFNTGAKLVNPHRVVLTTKDVLGIGVDSESSFTDLDVWFDKDSRRVKIEAMGVADAKLTNPDMFMVGI